MRNELLNSRIRFVLSFFFVFWINTVSAQQITATPFEEQFLNEKCAATYIEKKQVEQLGIYGTREYFEAWVEDKKEELQTQAHKYRTQADQKRVIPVVVHVIHNGTAVGQAANIPQSQIQAQIDILNQDYSRQNLDAADTPNEFVNVAAAANIEFVLAKQDPNGLPSNGINRVRGSKTTYTPDDEALIGALALWPPEDYMNIWVLPLQSPYLGYSAFPISELPGLNFPPNTRETDGVTIDYRVFGAGGNALSSSAGRTATHEIGHFFGLRHTWGDGGCEVDDFVEDTPNQQSANNTCRTSPRFTCDSRDMIENFMDYTPDECMNLFTFGQVDRIDVVLNFSPRRVSLVNGKATQTPDLNDNDLSLAAIASPLNFSCSLDAVPELMLLNVGGNTVTSATVAITLNGNRLGRKNFNVNIAPGATESVSFDAISLSASADNEFKAEIIAVNGKADPDPSDNTRITYPSIQPTVSLPYVFKGEDFSDLWTLKNPDNDITWNETTLPIDGQQQRLIYLNGYNYNIQDELDYFISPQINLAGSPDAQLKFKMAFASYVDNDFQESLLIAVSKDCGNTFELLEAPYQKSRDSLITAGLTSEQFIPDSEQQFRTELVNLSEYAGESDIRIAFVAVNGYGNNIFIKDIEILATEKYRYDFKIDQVVNPGPINDGSQEGEGLQITNTGNLPITNFVIQSVPGGALARSFVVENQLLAPGETSEYSLSNTLSEGLNKITYTIRSPNYDQNGGNSSTLVWHYIVDDSTVAVPWRQNFDDPSGIGAWQTINPQNNRNSWELTPLQDGGNNQVLSLENARNSNSYWLGSPLFDLSGTTQASIFFDWAAAGFTSSDLTALSMLISVDGGNVYKELWRKNNTEINTSSGRIISADDFERQQVDLSIFTGEGGEKVRIAFKADYEKGSLSPVYLDNLELFLSANPDPVDAGLDNTILYPNPAHDLFNVTFSLKDYEDVNVQIISAAGQVVHDVDYPGTLNQTYTFSTAVFGKGVFIIKITGDRIAATRRLIIR